LDFTTLWNLALVWNIERALMWLTGMTGSAGLAIIVFTLLVRAAMIPLSLQQIKSQKAMAALQPRLQELQQRHGGDRVRMSQEQMRLYKEAGVNPMAGCLPMVIQMPIWFALYSSLVNLSHNESSFQTSFLWIHNLALPSTPDPNSPETWPLVILPVATAVTQWIVQKMSTMTTSDPQQQQMNRMMEFMPFMFLIFSFQVAAGLTLYWVVSNLFSIVQQGFATGWSRFPILGSRAAAGPTSNGAGPTSALPRQPQPPSARRRGASSPGRKRKGK